MEPHQPAASPKRSLGRGSGAEPRDEGWLERMALDYVARYEASAAGVATLLERKIRTRCERTSESPGFYLERISGLIAQLVERGYLDDQRFAAGVLERQRRLGGSAAGIRARLAAKGISESLIDELFAREAPEIEFHAAWKLARLRRLGPYCVDPLKRQQSRDRHLGVLCRRGFEEETARQIVDAIAVPESI